MNNPMSVPYWRLSGFYFFYFATLGGFLPYWSLFLKESGFNPLKLASFLRCWLVQKSSHPIYGAGLPTIPGKVYE